VFWFLFLQLALYAFILVLNIYFAQLYKNFNFVLLHCPFHVFTRNYNKSLQ